MSLNFPSSVWAKLPSSNLKRSRPSSRFTPFLMKRVTVNAIAPGFIETPMTASMNQNALEEACKSIPLRRMGKPEELGFALACVADERNGYLAGVDVLCDGGSTNGKHFKKNK